MKPFKKIQQEVDDWTSQWQPQYWQPLEMLARVTEEVGELARELNHRFGAKRKKASEEEGDLGMEITDVIFALVCLANSQKIDLDESFNKMMGKYSTRDKDRFVRKT